VNGDRSALTVQIAREMYAVARPDAVFTPAKAP